MWTCASSRERSDLLRTGTVLTMLLVHGGTLDSTGLTHLGAREYDPSTGRFISDDPVTDTNDPQQINGYTYANGAPATMSDQDGRRPTCGEDGSVHACRVGEEGWRPPTRVYNPPPPPEACTVDTPEYCHAEGERQEGPYDILKKWFSNLVNGLLPKNSCGLFAMSPQCANYEYFRWGDEMTRELWMTDEFANIYLEIDRQAAAGIKGGRQDYHYTDMAKSEVFTHLLNDAISDVTGGVFGSSRFMAVTGSFDVDWKVVGYENGNPVVEYHVQNATTLYSGTRIPGLTPQRGDGSAGSGADAYGGEHFMIQSYRFRITTCVNAQCQN